MEVEFATIDAGVRRDVYRLSAEVRADITTSIRCINDVERCPLSSKLNYTTSSYKQHVNEINPANGGRIEKIRRAYHPKVRGSFHLSCF